MVGALIYFKNIFSNFQATEKGKNSFLYYCKFLPVDTNLTYFRLKLLYNHGKHLFPLYWYIFMY